MEKESDGSRENRLFSRNTTEGRKKGGNSTSVEMKVGKDEWKDPTMENYSLLQP